MHYHAKDQRGYVLFGYYFNHIVKRSGIGFPIELVRSKYMSKFICILIISTYLLISQTHKNYLVKEFFTSNHSNTYIILKAIKTDSIFVLLIEEEFNSKFRKIIKNDTLIYNLNLNYNYDLNSDTNKNFLIASFFYNGKNRISYIDENIKSGYLPDSCFVNR